MNSILLVNPPRAVMDAKNIWAGIADASLPISLIQLAAYVRERGFKVGVLDLCLGEFSEDEFRIRLENENSGYIGLTSTTVQIKNGLEVARIVKEVSPETKVVFGGVHSTVLTDEVISNESVDTVVRGEGEETLTEILSGKSLKDISGISFKENGRIINNPLRDFIKDIDALPFPAYDLVDLSKYSPTLGNFKQLPSISMITSRGCPGTCTFCYSGCMGKRIRFMTAERIFKEISHLHERYGIRDITFYDDTFTANKKNVSNLCSLLVNSGLGITWSCMSRIDAVDAKLVGEMKRAGCHQIGYGIESASPQILENIRKNVPLDKVSDVVDFTKRAGIDVRAMFMLGNPGETEKTMQETIDFALRLDPDLCLFNVTTPYPGTEMFKWADENGFLKTKDWDEYDLYHFVMELPTVSNEKISRYYDLGYKSFYMRPKYMFKRLLKINSWTLFKAHIHMLPHLLRW
ncbi:MAG: radical SAM protein [Methanobacteriota archaeon]